MESLQAIWQQILGMRWSDYLDIVIVAFLIYKLLPLFKSSGTMRIARIAVIVIVVAWLTELLQLHTISFLLSQVLAVGILAVVILFQPELRRMIDHLSYVKLSSFLGARKPQQEMEPVITQAVRACEVMSRERVGALIVFARDNRLDEYFKTGTMIEGRVSEQLIRNIFFPNVLLMFPATVQCVQWKEHVLFY